MNGHRTNLAAALALILVAMLAAGCSRPATVHHACAWIAGVPEPGFDPDGPPHALRASLERMLTRGLVEEDSSGAIVPAAARRIEVSSDSLVYTFHLLPHLVFTDGAPCTSARFRDALEGGLARTDHGTRAWLLSAVRGVDRVRAGALLPPIGIETPDDSTLIVRLVRPDRLLLAKLALPGVSGAWTSRAATDWKDARGLGPWRVAVSEPGRRLVLVSARVRSAVAGTSPVDTVIVRFVPYAARVRNMMRAGAADLIWPIPPALAREAPPAPYRVASRSAHPTRRLLLVMRADLPPTSKLPTRHALAHSLNRPELLATLRPLGEETGAWLRGASRFEFPKLDAREVASWMERGKLGRSFHVVMVFDADGPASVVARELQGEFARQSIYIELEPLSGERLATASVTGLGHLFLAESQGLLDDPASDLAQLVMPMRGPAVGSFRTGWRTREFDAWIAPRRVPPPFPADPIQQRLEEEMVVLPLADLPWVWIERSDHPVGNFHPRFGPGCDRVGEPGGQRPQDH
jgi:hypothetical protein